jgi:methylphosphotriester-DNA--protein-cysteine methyltransferase
MAEKNRVFFKSVEEAEAAGYKRAGNCPPEGEASQAKVATVALTPQTMPQTQKTKNIPPAKPAATEAIASTPAGAIIGNKNSKIFHRPNCPGYNSVSDKNQVRFKSVEEAEAAGYRAAKNCPAQ